MTVTSWCRCCIPGPGKVWANPTEAGLQVETNALQFFYRLFARTGTLTKRQHEVEGSASFNPRVQRDEAAVRGGFFLDSKSRQRDETRGPSTFLNETQLPRTSAGD